MALGFLLIVYDIPLASNDIIVDLSRRRLSWPFQYRSVDWRIYCFVVVDFWYLSLRFSLHSLQRRSPGVVMAKHSVRSDTVTNFCCPSPSESPQAVNEYYCTSKFMLWFNREPHDINAQIPGLLHPLDFLLPLLPRLTCGFWPLQTPDRSLSLKLYDYSNISASFCDKYSERRLHASAKNGFSFSTTSSHAALPCWDSYRLLRNSANTVASLS